MNRLISIIAVLALCTQAFALSAGKGNRGGVPSDGGTAYKAQLEELRSKCHLLKNAEKAKYFFFGMGPRRKMVYENGKLKDLRSGDVIVDLGPIRSDTIKPDCYEVEVELNNGNMLVISETETGVYVGKHRVKGTGKKIRLPQFEGKRWDRVLRVLHHEILFNIQPDGTPLPNAELYSRPFYRDAAYAMIALRLTDNARVMRPWVLGLSSVYDHARSDDYEETDNLGQALYITAPWKNKTAKFRKLIMAEAERIKRVSADGKFYISGPVDNMTCPVYSTAWLLAGMTACDMNTSQWALPDTLDKYTDLCWFVKNRTDVQRDNTYRDTFEWQTRKKNILMYPYLNIAHANYYADLRLMPMSTQDYPLTWEQVWKDDGGHECRTHLWAAAEMFILLFNQ